MASIAYTPRCPSFGSVSIGFVYKLRLSITNVSPVMDQYRITCEQRENTSLNSFIFQSPQVSIAPGMSTLLVVEFRAAAIGDCDCVLIVSQASDRSFQQINITATVITHDAFKRISRALALDSARPSLYAPGVKCVGQLPLEGGESYLSGAPSVFTENMIDDEDLEDLIDIPLFENMYWNPIMRKLCVDEELSAVATHPEWSIEQSQHESKMRWEERMCELESLGMCTHRILERLIHKSVSKSHTAESLQL